MHTRQDHDDFVCRERRHIARLSEKRHNLRSNIDYTAKARESTTLNRQFNDPIFNLLIAVEQLQSYAIKHLDFDLMEHGMTDVKGRNRYIAHQHCCCR